MAENTFKLKRGLTAAAPTFTFRLPVPYDVIQLQFHPFTAVPAATTSVVGDILTLVAIDEDGEEVALPGSPFALETADHILQFTWKGAAIKATMTFAGGTTTVTAWVKVKTFEESQGDLDRMTAYKAPPAAATIDSLSGD